MANEFNLPSVAGIVEGAASGLFNGVGNIIKNIKDGKIDLQVATQQVQIEIDRHKEVVMNGIQAETKSFLDDVADARQLQGKALIQNDNFSKRFIYYLAGVIILLVFSFDICLFFVNFPDKNRDIINSISGTLNASALIMVLSFFFGSSHSSQNKDVVIADALSSVNTK